MVFRRCSLAPINWNSATLARQARSQSAGPHARARGDSDCSICFGPYEEGEELRESQRELVEGGPS